MNILKIFSGLSILNSSFKLTDDSIEIVDTIKSCLINIGNTKVLVKKGEEVSVGQIIAEKTNDVDLSVISPVNGVVAEVIEKFDKNGEKIKSIVINEIKFFEKKNQEINIYGLNEESILNKMDELYIANDDEKSLASSIKAFDGNKVQIKIFDTEQNFKYEEIKEILSSEFEKGIEVLQKAKKWEVVLVNKASDLSSEGLIIDMSTVIKLGDAFLTGLTVDKFEDYYVIQISTFGMEQYKDLVVKILKEDYNAKGIYERSDLRTREIEGLEQTKGFLTEEFNTDIEIIENGVKYIVDLANGQKTGFFLDQKENRAAMHRICKDKDVLDCFTHTGSFALNAGIAGAKSVLGIDVSQHAIDCATRNAELNNLEDTVKFECHNAFDVLGEWSREGKEFDVVILDPPAFTKSRNTVNAAIRGYKEINLRGLKMVKSGGYFATCSCSHYMSEEQLKKTVLEAAHDARKTLRQVEVRTQSSDHPILWNSDESYYLKFFIFQVI